MSKLNFFQGRNPPEQSRALRLNPGIHLVGYEINSGILGVVFKNDESGLLSVNPCWMYFTRTATGMVILASVMIEISSKTLLPVMRNSCGADFSPGFFDWVKH